MNVVIYGLGRSVDDLAALAPAESAVSSRGYALLHWTAPLLVAQREALRQHVTLLEVVEGHAYVIRLRAGDEKEKSKTLTLIGTLPVRLLPYVSALRIGHLQQSFFPGSRMSVDVVAHRDAALATMLEDQRLQGSSLRTTPWGLRGEITRPMLDVLGNDDRVRHVEPTPRFRSASGIATATVMRASDPNATRFKGKGEIVVVCDVGLCDGTTDALHPAFGDRVLHVSHLEGRDPTDLPDSHGTAVASCAVGQPAGDVDGFGGAAPEAGLIAISISDEARRDPELPCDMSRLFTHWNGPGRTPIYNFSFEDAGNEADVHAQVSTEVDKQVHGNPKTVVCVAAGNNGGVLQPPSQGFALRSVGAPATAKNVITVGACENDRPDIVTTYLQLLGPPFDVPPFKGDPIANAPGQTMLHSSRGPAAGGRIKPDLLAPGTSLLVASATEQKPRPWGSSAHPRYHFAGGTSMAAPLVAGACAVVRQWLREIHGMNEPSAALIKAILIAGAVPLSLPGSNGSVPDSIQGFGRVDLARSLSIAPGCLRDEAGPLDTGVEWSVEVDIGNVERLTVTLVWTDEPGAVLANDLDLRVECEQETRLGNRSATDAEPDAANNVERVRWEAPPKGKATIRVRGAHCAMNAQRFAIVWLME